MAVNAKSDGGIIEATNAIIDTLTPEVFRTEFRPFLQEMQARRDTVSVARLNDPNVIEILEGVTPPTYSTSGLYAPIWRDAYIRIGMTNRKLICSDEEPVLVIKLSLNGLTKAKGVNKTFYRYLIGDVGEDEFLEAILKDAKRKVTAQLRKFMLGKPSIGELFNRRVPHQFFTDDQILDGMIATPTYLYKKSAAEWDEVLPDWIDHLERYIAQHLSFSYSKTGFSDFMPAMVPIMDRISESCKNTLYCKIVQEAIDRGSALLLNHYVEVPDHIVREVMDHYCSELVNTQATIDVGFRAIDSSSGKYSFNEEISGEQCAHSLIQTTGLVDTCEYSRLMINPDVPRTRVAEGDRLVFTPGGSRGDSLLGQVRKFASSELLIYLDSRHGWRTNMTYTPTATLAWFHIIAESAYTAKVTIIHPSEKEYKGLQVLDEMQAAIQATLDYERSTILANWDLLASATGLYIELNLDKYEEFWNSVVVDLIQFDPITGNSWRTPYTNVFSGQLLEKR